MYGQSALADSLTAWFGGGPHCSGEFARDGAWVAPFKSEPLRARQGDANQELTGLEALVKTGVSGDPARGWAFGLEWTGNSHGVFPEYFREVDGKMQVIAEGDVPPETELRQQAFPVKRPGGPYTSPTGAGSAWTTPGPVRGPFSAKLTDGSTVMYSWYRFVDQPALRQYRLTEAARNRLQAESIRIHREWKADGKYMPPPTSGTLAALDAALLVQPPKGLEAGFVPIVTRQEI